MFLLLLLIGVLPTMYPLLKLLNRRDINIFDIFQLTSCLYYVLIPIKVLYFDLPTLKVYYINDLESPSYYLLFGCLLFLFNFLWTRTNRLAYSPINVTSYIRIIDQQIILKKKNVYIFFVFFCLLLIPLSNYSSLSNEALEGNVTAGYGLNVGFLDRIRLIFLYNTYPVFILLSLKYFNQPDLIRYRKLAILSLVLGALCMFLGSKSTMFFTIIICILYYYAVNREKVNKKFIIKSLVISAIVVFVLFPLSQNFRTVKHTLIQNGTAHSFMDVAYSFANSDVSQAKELGVKYQIYKARSLNVYQVLHWACTKNFRGEGKLTLLTYQYLVPQYLDSKEGNILGNIYVGKDADIGESCLAWFIADWGFVGVFITLLHYFIVINIWIVYKNIFLSIFKDKKIEYLFFVLYLMEFISLEFNPAGYFHGFYSEKFITFLVFILVFKLFNLLTGSKS